MDTQQQVADCVGAIYEAATGGIEWHEVGARLCRLMDAHSCFVSGGTIASSLKSDGEARAVYSAYYHRLNPYVARARLDFALDRALHIARAVPGEALVPDEKFLRSEYYLNFAKPYDHRYMIGGMLGVREATPLALYRAHNHRPFEGRDVRLLQMLLPHFQRGLELDERLGPARMSLAMLDAFPTAVAIVDADLHVEFLNAAGRTLVAGPRGPLSVQRCGGGHGDLRLAARSRRETALLRGLAASAAQGETGGSLRILGDEGSFAALVSPAPGGLVAGDPERGLVRGYALITLQPLRRAMTPSLTVLCDVLGLSMAEANVAASLYGGRSAEDVAKQRGVSLPTIRNQIRSILVKTEAENLRDLERILAGLTAVSPQ